MCKENKNTFYVQYFFLNIVPLWENVKKYSRTEQATDGNMAYAHCMLDN